MTNQRKLLRQTCIKLCLAILCLTLLALPFKAKENSSSAPLPAETCITQSFIKIEKVLYQGKDNQGRDAVNVEWSNHANSSCVRFGGGFDIPNQANIPPFGSEVTVKIKRRFGHEDVQTSKGSSGSDWNDTVTHNVYFHRDTLETDPVSFEVKVRTTAGAVLTRTAQLKGNGAPSFSAATQTFTHHSSIPGQLTTCFPSLQVSALDFFPGAGPKPDRITINWAAGLPPVASCLEPPKISVIVRLTRPNGVVDVGQANINAGSTTATIALPGTPGAVASFEILVTASTGVVLEKVSTSNGPF